MVVEDVWIFAARSRKLTDLLCTWIVFIVWVPPGKWRKWNLRNTFTVSLFICGLNIKAYDRILFIFCFSSTFHDLYNKQQQIKLRWALFVTFTIIQSIMRSEMCSLHLTHPSGAVGSRHCSARGAVLGFGALLKGLTSVVDTSCLSRDSNPQPWVTSGFKSNALTIRPDFTISHWYLWETYYLVTSYKLRSFHPKAIFTVL